LHSAAPLFARHSRHEPLVRAAGDSGRRANKGRHAIPERQSAHRNTRTERVLDQRKACK